MNESFRVRIHNRGFTQRFDVSSNEVGPYHTAAWGVVNVVYIARDTAGHLSRVGLEGEVLKGIHRRRSERSGFKEVQIGPNSKRGVQSFGKSQMVYVEPLTQDESVSIGSESTLDNLLKDPAYSDLLRFHPRAQYNAER